MDSLSAGDCLFLGYSNYNLANTHVITFNKTMMAQYENALDESVYSMVDNYRWTLDQMISIANLVYIDKTSDGKTEDDTFGNRELLDLMRKYDMPCSLSGIGVKPIDEALEEYYKILKNSSAIEESGSDANIKLREALEYLWGLG